MFIAVRTGLEPARQACILTRLNYRTIFSCNPRWLCSLALPSLFLDCECKVRNLFYSMQISAVHFLLMNAIFSPRLTVDMDCMLYKVLRIRTIWLCRFIAAALWSQCVPAPSPREQ